MALLRHRRSARTWTRSKSQNASKCSRRACATLISLRRVRLRAVRATPRVRLECRRLELRVQPLVAIKPAQIRAAKTILDLTRTTEPTALLPTTLSKVQTSLNVGPARHFTHSFPFSAFPTAHKTLFKLLFFFLVRDDTPSSYPAPFSSLFSLQVWSISITLCCTTITFPLSS